MKAVLRTTNPDSIEMTLTITMEVRDWKRLRDQLESDYPGWRLSSAIRSLINKAESHFEEEGTMEP